MSNKASVSCLNLPTNRGRGVKTRVGASLLAMSLAAASLIVLSEPSSAARRKPRKPKKKYTREETLNYERPAGPSLHGPGPLVVGQIASPPHRFESRRTDRFVSIAVSDDQSQAVPGWVGIDANSDGIVGEAEEGHYFCSSIPDLAINGGAIIEIAVFAGNCEDVNTVGAATSGTITARFTNRR